MLVKCLLLCLAIVAFASSASAQELNPSFQSSLLFTPVRQLSQLEKTPPPPFLQSMHEIGSSQAGQPSATLSEKVCPMPVYRPDTTRLEKMKIALPSPAVVYSMPRAELRCPNPLDAGK